MLTLTAVVVATSLVIVSPIFTIIFMGLAYEYILSRQKLRSSSTDARRQARSEDAP